VAVADRLLVAFLEVPREPGEREEYGDGDEDVGSEDVPDV
jgi:hypothetical protein